MAKLTHTIERKLPINNRAEVLRRLEKLKSEILDMDTAVKEDMDNKELTDKDIFRISEKNKRFRKTNPKCN